MMKILIMRHAAALSRSACEARYDAERRLSAVGREQAGKVGNLIRDLGCRPDPVVCSPFVRTQETADIVSRVFDPAPTMLPLTILAPGSGPDELLRAAVNHGTPTRQWLMAVMHEPDVSCILGHWLFPDCGYPFDVREGDIFAVEVTFEGGTSHGRLLFLYSPSALELVREPAPASPD